MEGGGLTSEDHDDRMHILFEPFNDTECLFEDGIADVPARLVLCFGDVDDDGPLALAEKLVSSFRNGKGAFVEVEGRLTVYHDDEGLPPTAFRNGTAPEWLQQIVDTYRKDGSPLLLKELRRLEGLVQAVTSHEPDSYFDEEQNEARTDARVAQDFVLGSRKPMREKLDAAVDALRHYAQGDDNERALAVLAFIGKKGS